MTLDRVRAGLRSPAGRLALVAILVYLPGFWWGAPRALDDESIRSWGVDDEAPIGPLAQVHNIIEPKEVQNLGYPLMHSFMSTAAYAPYLATLWVTGDFAEPSGEYPYGLADPVRSLQVMTWLAHLLSVLLGAGIVAAAVLAGQRLWGEREGLWAGVFTMVSLPMVYYSRTGNVDVPSLFFAAAALAVFAGMLQSGPRVRNALWLGMLVGFATATKEQTAALFLGVPVILVLLLWQQRGAPKDGEAPANPVMVLGAGLVACIVAFGFGSGLFVDPDRYIAHLEFARERVDLLRSGDIPFMPYYERDLEGNLSLMWLQTKYLAGVVTWPGIVLGFIGILASIRDRRRSAWMAIPYITYVVVLFWAARNGQLRYAMPAGFVLTLFAARGLCYALENRGFVRTFAASAAGWVMFAGILQTVDLTYQMVRDSRYETTAWLEARLEPGDRLEFFGPDAKLPWMPEGIERGRANEYLGAVFPPKRDAAAAREIRARWVLRHPDVILVMPDVSSREGEPHNVTLPPVIYDELMSGALGYDLAETFWTEPLFPWLPTPDLDYPSVNPPIRVFVPRVPRS